MNRDELRELLQGLRSVAYDAGESRFVKRAENAIAWLERLPAGCALSGVEYDGDILMTHDGDAIHGYIAKDEIHPDDIPKAGKR